MSDPNNKDCLKCEARLPSCVGKTAGNHTFPGRELSPYYVVCLQDRTLAVRSCDNGYFDGTTQQCALSLTPGVYIHLEQ